MYKRKTEDEWELHGDYGYGDDYILTCEDYKDAKEQLKCYRAAAKEGHDVCGLNIVKKRIKL